MLQSSRKSQKKGWMWLISRAVAWQLLSIRAGQLPLSPCTTSRKRLAINVEFRAIALIGQRQTLAEVATWPKLAKTEDVEPYMQQNIKDGADYTKLSQSSKFEADALAYSPSA